MFENPRRGRQARNFIHRQIYSHFFYFNLDKVVHSEETNCQANKEKKKRKITFYRFPLSAAYPCLIQKSIKSLFLHITPFYDDATSQTVHQIFSACLCRA